MTNGNSTSQTHDTSSTETPATIPVVLRIVETLTHKIEVDAPVDITHDPKALRAWVEETEPYLDEIGDLTIFSVDERRILGIAVRRD